MKTLNNNTEKNANFANNAEVAENKELTKHQAQFNRLIIASREARKIKEELIEERLGSRFAVRLRTLSLNYFILKHVYRTQGVKAEVFKTFEEWNNEGASVKKGAKAFPIWGQPFYIFVDCENPDDGVVKKKIYPISYVFSNLQVVQAEKDENGLTPNFKNRGGIGFHIQF